jgi:hypothetical protein
MKPNKHIIRVRLFLERECSFFSKFLTWGGRLHASLLPVLGPPSLLGGFCFSRTRSGGGFVSKLFWVVEFVFVLLFFFLFFFDRKDFMLAFGVGDRLFPRVSGVLSGQALEVLSPYARSVTFHLLFHDTHSPVVFTVFFYSGRRSLVVSTFVLAQRVVYTRWRFFSCIGTCCSRPAF